MSVPGGGHKLDALATEAATERAFKADLTREGPRPPNLHRIEHQFGHVPEVALPTIAEARGRDALAKVPAEEPRVAAHVFATGGNAVVSYG